MNSIKILVVLFLLFQLTYTLKAQEIHNPTKTTFYNQDKTTPLSNAVSDSLIYFHYDKIVGEFSTQIEGDFLIENLTTQDWNQSLSSWKTYSIYEYSYIARSAPIRRAPCPCRRCGCMPRCRTPKSSSPSG